MSGREGLVAGWVPILRQDHMGEARGHLIDQRYDLVAGGNREAAARTEIVLKVDDQENITRPNGKMLWHYIFPCGETITFLGAQPPSLSRW